MKLLASSLYRKSSCARISAETEPRLDIRIEWISRAVAALFIGRTRARARLFRRQCVGIDFFPSRLYTFSDFFLFFFSKKIFSASSFRFSRINLDACIAFNSKVFCVDFLSRGLEMIGYIYNKPALIAPFGGGVRLSMQMAIRESALFAFLCIQGSGSASFTHSLYTILMLETYYSDAILLAAF